jgi:fibronectin type 3 domain-containing protein
MNVFLQSTRGPLNLLGAFVLVIAGICLPTAAGAGQLKPTSNTSTQSSSVQAQTGTQQTAQASTQPPSCTPEMSTQGNARPSLHSVILSWKASTSPGVAGYNVYRRDKTSDTFSKINQKPVSTTSCIDYFVQLRHTYYYYVVTADRPGVRESGSSNIAPAEIPPQ